MRRTWPLRAAFACLVAVAGVSAADARPAGESHPQRLGDGPSIDDLDGPAATAIATGPDGLAVALVRQDGRVVVRRARPGPNIGLAHRLPLGTSAQTTTAAAGAGFAALAWTHFDATFFPAPFDREEACCRRVRAALLERSGRVTHPQTLSAPGANVGHVFVAVHGRRAALAWIDTRGVRTSAGLRGVGFHRPATITTPSGRALLGVALPGATPHVFVVVGYTRPRIVEAWRSGGRTHRRTLGPFHLDPYLTQAVVAPTGSLLLAAFAGRMATERIVFLWRRPGGRLRNLSVRGASSAATAAVALASSGRGVIAIPERRGALTLRPVDRLGHVGRARSIATPRRLIDMAIAIAPSGAGVIAAIALSGSNETEREHIVAWPLGLGSRPGSPRNVTARMRMGMSALAATFDRRVAWFQSDDGATYAARVR